MAVQTTITQKLKELKVKYMLLYIILCIFTWLYTCNMDETVFMMLALCAPQALYLFVDFFFSVMSVRTILKKKLSGFSFFHKS